MSQADLNLANKVVLVTRPQHQSAEFIRLVNEQGGKAHSFPSIDIQAIELDASAIEIVKQINSYDMLIFVSANAVTHFMQCLRAQNIEPIMVTTLVAVIGKATGLAAMRAGLKDYIEPAHGFNSDALLEMREFKAVQVNEKKILVVRGRGGLEQLANTLTQRGAQVSYLEVYQRSMPQSDRQIDRQQLIQDWSKMGINVITVTSNESLQNLYDMLESSGRKAMLNTPLIVPSKRCADLAKGLGFKTFRIARSAANQHMLEAISLI